MTKSLLLLSLFFGFSHAWRGQNELITQFIQDTKQYATKRLQETGEEFSPLSEYPYWNIFPSLKTAVFLDGKSPTEAWSSECFGSNVASATLSADKRQVTVTITSNGASSSQKKCSDFYMFACTSSSVDGLVETSGQLDAVVSEVVLELPEDITDAEWWDIENKGIRISLYHDKPATVFSNLLVTVSLFEAEVTTVVTPETAEKTVDFLNSYTNNNQIHPIDPNSVSPPDESEIHSGDFFGLIYYNGVGPLMGWATGATLGHTTVALWIGDELNVCESTSKSASWPVNGVQCTPYRKWLELVAAEQEQMVWARLKPSLREQFNESAALEFFRGVEGNDYGFRTLLWGWIDDAIYNMPCLPPDFSSRCGSWAYFETSLAIIDRKMPDLGKMMWNPGMAKRLGVSDELRTSELYKIAADQNMTTDYLISIPEQDDWVYNTTRFGQPAVGKDMVCDVFVCNIWKAGGLFGDLADKFNCAELTPWDVYSLDFFDPDYIQIMGNYSLVLEFDFNTKTPYEGMCESCPSLPPDYVKDDNC